MSCPVVGYGITVGGIHYFSLQHSYEIFRALSGNTRLFIKNLVLNSIYETIDCVNLDNQKITYARTMFRNNVRAIWYPKPNLDLNRLQDLAVVTKIDNICMEGIPNPCSEYVSIREDITSYANFEGDTVNLTGLGVSPTLYQYATQFDYNGSLKLTNVRPEIGATKWHTATYTYENVIPMHCSNFLTTESLIYIQQKRELRRRVETPNYDDTDYTDLETILTYL